MQQRQKTEIPTGPALKAEQVSELWVWIWSAIDSSATRFERDEAQRLAVAFERAIDRIRFQHDSAYERFIRDQGPVSTALLAHYLLTRIDQWARKSGTEEAQRRLHVLTGAAQLLGSLLTVDVRELVPHFERLGISLENSIFFPEVREGVVIESLEEGPALPGEHKARAAEAHGRLTAKWDAERNRPKKRRQVTEGSR